ncbi:MAG TPA: hypothetical protein VLJ37_04270 [bacterium]|nr:hypothetical protein [bacterium]
MYQKNNRLFTVFALGCLLSWIPSELRAPPIRTWFDQIRVFTDLRIAEPISPPTYPPLNLTGTFKSFVSGDNIVDQFRYNKIAEVACKAVFQASAPLYDGSTETVEIVVPFSQRFPEDEDYTMPLQVVCHALEHAVEAEIPAKIAATIKSWGPTADQRVALLQIVTLSRIDEAALNLLPMGTVGCSEPEACIAEGPPIRIEARVWPPSTLKEMADFCVADLSADNGAARFRVRVNFGSSRINGLYDKSVPEKAMYNFYLVQQCRNLVMGLCAEKVAHVKGPVTTAGTVEAKVVTIHEPSGTP